MPRETCPSGGEVRLSDHILISATVNLDSDLPVEQKHTLKPDEETQSEFIETIIGER